MKKYSEFEKSNPGCIFPDLVPSHYRIADKAYYNLLDEILLEEPAIHPKGKENLAFVTDAVRSLFGQKTLFKTIFEPKHLLACVKLELPFLVFDEATLKLINLNSEAIEGIYIKPEYNRLVIIMIIECRKGKKPFRG